MDGSGMCVERTGFGESVILRVLRFIPFYLNTPFALSLLSTARPQIISTSQKIATRQHAHLFVRALRSLFISHDTSAALGVFGPSIENDISVATNERIIFAFISRSLGLSTSAS